MSVLIEKSIEELHGKHFNIPSYQRGYRWNDQQITDLLNDVWEFTQKLNKKPSEWYCLQPIVLKQIENEIVYDVIDGQQRLTSIFLVLKYLEPENFFNIEYETRNTGNSNSKEFLENIYAKTNIDSKANIDYFHIYNAYHTIKKWFETSENKKEAFKNTFLKNTKVIWYEVSSVKEEKDEIDIFSRINMGKIPLTNAELIKALFLNNSNFKDSDIEKIRLIQLEIASEWDRMEYSLQNDEFWYFINNSENIYPTRIEFLFYTMYSIAKSECSEAKYRKEKRIQDKDEINERKVAGNLTFDEKYGIDEYPTFRFFSEKFKKNNSDEINTNWKEIKRIFQTIQEWFNDRELYHKIGYLISVDTKLKELLKELENRKKQDFRKMLDDKIVEKVKCGNLEELEYGKDNTLITNILLLHNISLTLKNRNELQRFPFSKYKNKKDGWSLEHIHAQNSKEIHERKDFIAWYNSIDKEFKNEIPKELVDEISKLVEQENDSQINIPELISKISAFFGEIDLHTIDNLALLSKNDNSSLNNSIFPIKRNKIIELEKNGSFIPDATKQVFQKYFDGCTKQLSKWENDDRKAYLNDIKTNLLIFSTKNNEN